MIGEMGQNGFSAVGSLFSDSLLGNGGAAFLLVTAVSIILNGNEFQIYTSNTWKSVSAY